MLLLIWKSKKKTDKKQKYIYHNIKEKKTDRNRSKSKAKQRSKKWKSWSNWRIEKISLIVKNKFMNVNFFKKKNQKLNSLSKVNGVFLTREQKKKI